MTLSPDLKPLYRQWCNLVVQQWERESSWGRFLNKAQALGIPVEQMPTHVDGFVHYKTPLRALIAQRLPLLSQKLFDANDKIERALVALWLMQNPQTALPAPKSTKAPFDEVKRQTRKNEQLMQADDMGHRATHEGFAAGAHVPVRGAISRRRIRG